MRARVVRKLLKMCKFLALFAKFTNFQIPKPNNLQAKLKIYKISNTQTQQFTSKVNFLSKLITSNRQVAGGGGDQRARPWPLGRDWLTRRQVTRSRVVRTQVTEAQVVTRSKIVAYYDEGKDKKL